MNKVLLVDSESDLQKQQRTDKLVGQMLQRLGVAEDQVEICHDPPQVANLRCKPDCLLVMGPEAVAALLPEPFDKAGVDIRRGYVEWSPELGLWAIPTIHPNFIARGNQKLTGVWMNDVQHALDIAKHGHTPAKIFTLEDPTPMEFLGWVNGYEAELQRHGDTVLSYDIETLGKQSKDEDEIELGDASYEIIRIGFSYRPDEAVSIPWSAEFMSGVARLMGSMGTKLGWNTSYDRPRVESKRIVINGPQHDGMWAWHVANSDLRKNLGFVATFYAWDQPRWKHLGHVNPAYYNCLQKGTLVVMADGSHQPIERLVATRSTQNVLTMSETGEIVPTQIVGWHRQICHDQQWLQIHVDATTQSIKCTPDHKIWTRDGWVEAKDLRPGAEVKLARNGSDSLIHGTILGDAHVDSRGRLCITQSTKQREWFMRKRAALSGGAFYTSVGGYGDEHLSCEGWVSKKRWREKFYSSEGKRFIPPPDAAALAVWYCDDGCLVDQTPRIAAMGFSNPGELFVWAQSQYQTVSQYNVREDGGFALAIRNKAFFEDIAAFVPPEMAYKLPEAYRNRYNGWLERPEAQWSVVTSVLDITDQPRKGRGYKTVRYCLDVAHNTHRFFTVGGLVKNCLDAAVTLKIYLGVGEDLKELNLWDVYLRHVCELDQNILWKMSKAGVLLDDGARRSASTQLEGQMAEVNAQMETIVPIEARRLKVFKQRKAADRALAEDPNARLVEIPSTRKAKVCTACGEIDITKPHVTKKTLKNQTLPLIEGVVGPKENIKVPNPCLGAEVVTRQVGSVEFGVTQPFTPSNTQMIQYQRVAKHKPVLTREKRPTFDDDALKRLQKTYPKDGLYPLVLAYRNVEKILSTYIGYWNSELLRWDGGLEVGVDGRVHATYLHNPSTLRLSSQNPNVQVWPRGATPEARLVKRLVIAAPGYRLTEVDFSAIEAVLVGYFAGSANYMRLAKLGIHDYVLSHMLLRDGKIDHAADLTLSDADLKAYYKDLKKRFNGVRDVAKRVVHMCLTPEHEVLTPQGWLQLKELTTDHHIAQWANGQLSFVQPSVVNKYHVEHATMHTLRGRGIYVESTAEHRTPVYKDVSGPLHAIPAGDLPAIGRIPITGELAGTEGWTEWLRLAVAIQADATLTPSGVVFHLKKQRKVERLLGICQVLGINVSHSTYADGTHGIRLRGPEISEALAWLSTTKTFDLPRLLTLTIDARIEMLKETLLWDGTSAESSPTAARGNRKAYFTTNYANAVSLQTLAHTCGFQALLSKRCLDGYNKFFYVVSFNQRKYARIECADHKTYTLTGDVYCPTVESGWFLVKYGDRISITGNSNYGGTPQRMNQSNPESFPTVKAARELQALYFDICPDVKAWQEHTVAMADRQGYLRNPFGYLHRFWQVRNWVKERDGRWVASWGEDAKRGLAFLPQSTASGLLKEAMLRLQHTAVAPYMRLQVHDSLLCEIPEGEVDEMCRLLRAEMEKPSEYLPLNPAWGLGDFLSIGTETKTGLSWGQMEEWNG